MKVTDRKSLIFAVGGWMILKRSQRWHEIDRARKTAREIMSRAALV